MFLVSLQPHAVFPPCFCCLIPALVRSLTEKCLDMIIYSSETMICGMMVVVQAFIVALKIIFLVFPNEASGNYQHCADLCVLL